MLCQSQASKSHNFFVSVILPHRRHLFQQTASHHIILLRASPVSVLLFGSLPGLGGCWQPAASFLSPPSPTIFGNWHQSWLGRVLQHGLSAAEQTPSRARRISTHHPPTHPPATHHHALPPLQALAQTRRSEPTHKAMAASHLAEFRHLRSRSLNTYPSSSSSSSSPSPGAAHNQNGRIANGNNVKGPMAAANQRFDGPRSPPSMCHPSCPFVFSSFSHVQSFISLHHRLFFCASRTPSRRQAGGRGVLVAERGDAGAVRLFTAQNDGTSNVLILSYPFPYLALLRCPTTYRIFSRPMSLCACCFIRLALLRAPERCQKFCRGRGPLSHPSAPRPLSPCCLGLRCSLRSALSALLISCFSSRVAAAFDRTKSPFKNIRGNCANMSQLTTPAAASNRADTSHVPCKFFRQGACQAGNACPFSHDLSMAAENVCKYFAKVSRSWLNPFFFVFSLCAFRGARFGQT